MTTKANNPVIARAGCPTLGCSGRIGIMQNARGYLYSRCPSCGIDQKNGAPFQVWLWQNLEPVEGAVIRRPDNVPESAGAMGCALRGEAPKAVEAPAKKPEAARVPADSADDVRAADDALGGGPKGAGSGDDAPIGAGDQKTGRGGAGLLWLVIGAATMGVAALASAKG